MTDEILADVSEQDSLITLLYLLKRYAEFILQGSENSARALLPSLTELMSSIFPKIINSYDKPQLERYREDKEYWLGQLKRIMDVLSKDDMMAQMDVLYFETYKNLLEYQRILQEEGIIWD